MLQVVTALSGGRPAERGRVGMRQPQEHNLSWGFQRPLTARRRRWRQRVNIAHKGAGTWEMANQNTRGLIYQLWLHIVLCINVFCT